MVTPCPSGCGRCWKGRKNVNEIMFVDWTMGPDCLCQTRNARRAKQLKKVLSRQRSMARRRINAARLYECIETLKHAAEGTAALCGLVFGPAILAGLLFGPELIP